jgi:RNA polymerase-binding transcription factor DksA
LEHDILDQAAALADSLRDAGVAAVRQLVPVEKQELNADDLECEICADEIPEKRAARGYTTCVRCQTELEHRHKRTRVRSSED